MRVKGAKKNPKLTAVADGGAGNTVAKPTIHNVYIIDASGSMAGMKYENAIAGVNLNLENIREDKETNNTVTIVEFEEHRVVTRVDMESDYTKKYKAMGTGDRTPLNQAIGETLEAVFVKRKERFNSSDKVLVNIFTDGGENSSQGKYRNKAVLSEYIKALEEQGFTVTFVGTKQEVAYAINSLNVAASNTLVHMNTADSIEKSFKTTLKARSLYSKSVAKGEDVTRSFYSKTVSE